MNTPKEVFEHILKSMNNTEIGLCINLYLVCQAGIISRDLYLKTKMVLNVNRPSPTKFPRYYRHRYAIRDTRHGHWWIVNEKGFEIRKQYLKELIESL